MKLYPRTGLAQHGDFGHIDYFKSLNEINEITIDYFSGVNVHFKWVVTPYYLPVKER